MCSHKNSSSLLSLPKQNSEQKAGSRDTRREKEIKQKKAKNNPDDGKQRKRLV